MSIHSKGLFITSTDTGVGKTVITAGILGALRKHGEDAIAIKPIQSGGILRENRIVSEDTFFYGTVTDLPYSDRDLNPVCLQASLAPAVAAEIEGVNINLDTILDHYQRISARHRLTLVEGAGGLLVPLIETKITIADLAVKMDLPLLIVTRPNLGTINHTCLTVEYAKSRGLKLAGIIINFYDYQNSGPAEKTNPGLIEKMTGVPVLGLVPKIEGLSVEGENPQAGDLISIIEKYVNLEQLLKAIDN
ncbi:MAG TPA: dethiobiotin synthase [Desulfitobacteriaceae bacterium]|nr:dethiobiotin synthase [Desulfitobacteriaceae bacterium]